MTANRRVPGLGVLRDKVHVLLVKLAVLQLDLDRHMIVEFLRQRDCVMCCLAGARRDLVVVKRDANVLRIAAVDPIAVLIQEEDVDEVGPRVDCLGFVHAATATDDLAVAGDLHIDPDLVGVNGPL